MCSFALLDRFIPLYSSNYAIIHKESDVMGFAGCKYPLRGDLSYAGVAESCLFNYDSNGSSPCWSSLERDSSVVLGRSERIAGAFAHEKPDRTPLFEI